MLSQILDYYIAQLRVSWKLSADDELKKHVSDILMSMTKNQDLRNHLRTELSLKNATELHRDREFGFILTAYTEKAGQYRVPHNHGDGWVVYAVMDGVMEMGTFEYSDGKISKLSSYKLNSGDAKVYYPGDIHDTLCISDQVIILRFTNCDLKTEENKGRMKRFEYV